MKMFVVVRFTFFFNFFVVHVSLGLGVVLFSQLIVSISFVLSIFLFVFPVGPNVGGASVTSSVASVTCPVTHLKLIRVTTARLAYNRMKNFSRQKFGAKTPPLEKYSNFSRQIFGAKNLSRSTSMMPLSTSRMHSVPQETCKD